MILKNFLVERNLSLIDPYFLTLFYGENIGQKDEIKFELKKKFKEYEQISFNQEEIIKNENLLYEQINNVSLFSKQKVIFINEISDKIKNKIAEIIENPSDQVKIFCFAQNLDKKSGIRSIFEKSKKLGIIPCYQDNHRTLSEYLQKKLKDYTGVNQEIINLLIENSGLNRKIISNEIDKIKSLFTNKKIDSEKLLDLLNNVYDLDFNDIRDSCFEGNKEKLNKSLANIILQNEDAYLYLNNLNLRVQKLLEILNQYKKHKNIDLALDNLSPKIFWKDKPIILRQVKKWNLEKLEIAKNKILDAEIKMKTKMNSYNPIIIKNLVIKLYVLANSTSS